MIPRDKKNDSSNEYALEICETDKVCSVDYKIDNFKMVSDDYNISVSKKLISSFEGKTGVQYWIAAESTSTFE